MYCDLYQWSHKNLHWQIWEDELHCICCEFWNDKNVRLSEMRVQVTVSFIHISIIGYSNVPASTVYHTRKLATSFCLINIRVYPLHSPPMFTWNHIITMCAEDYADDRSIDRKKNSTWTTGIIHLDALGRILCFTAWTRLAATNWIKTSMAFGYFCVYNLYIFSL